MCPSLLSQSRGLSLTRRIFAGILCVFQENATQYGGKRPVQTAFEVVNAHPTERGLLEFCKTPRTRKEIVKSLGIASSQYAIRRYLEPLVTSGTISISIPDRPKNPKQTYQTNL